MKIIKISAKDHQKYDQFVMAHPLGNIHQTWQWGMLQTKTAGRDHFWALALEDEKGKIQASALIISQKLPFNKCWLYCPYGPLIDFENEKLLHNLLEKISEIAKEQNAVFFRLETAHPTPIEHFAKQNPKNRNSSFVIRNSRPAHAHYQPQNTLLIDLAPSSEEILKQMKIKGRYNIKVAQKHKVQVHESQNPAEDIHLFYDLFKQTTTRDQFSGHSLRYYQNFLEMLAPDSDHSEASSVDTLQRQTSPQAKLYLAQYQGKPIAAAICAYYKDTATYYFGASSRDHRNVMAPYLLQWEVMLAAKHAGYLWYDFFGISPENAPDHSWAKVTEFKLKFGGKRVDYLPAKEMVYQPFWYYIIRFVKIFNKKFKRRRKKFFNK